MRLSPDINRRLDTPTATHRASAPCLFISEKNRRHDRESNRCMRYEEQKLADDRAGWMERDKNHHCSVLRSNPSSDQEDH